jgi:hypothetical protein
MLSLSKHPVMLSLSKHPVMLSLSKHDPPASRCLRRAQTARFDKLSVTRGDVLRQAQDDRKLRMTGSSG